MQQVFDAHGQFAHADAGGMVDGCCDGRGNAGEADFANAARAVLVHDKVRVLDEGDVDLRCVGAGGHQVVGHAAVDRLAAALIVDSLLKQAHANAHDYGSHDLIGCCFVVDDASSIDDTDHATDAQAGDFGFPLDFDELAAVGVQREVFSLGVFKGGDGFAFAGDAAQLAEDDYLFEGNACARG